MELTLLKNASLKPYNTFGIDVKAKLMGKFCSKEELNAFLQLDSIQEEPLFILGGGSNVLLTKNYEGLVLKNEIPNIELVKEDTNHFYVTAGAGVLWHDFVIHCIEKGYAGVENLSLIPGNVGAAPMQNIGAYGVELKDVFSSLEAYDIQNKKLLTFDKSECNFGYRESVFKKELKNKCVILNVTFKLNKKADINTAYGSIKDELKHMNVKEIDIKAISQAVINIRRSKLPDPVKIGNAGSFFKNPVIDNNHAEDLKKEFPNIVTYPVGDQDSKVAAGWLIDNLGWKGKTFNNYGVHDKQALVLVNHGGALGKDLYDLSQEIIESVQKTYRIKLDREVNIY